MTEGPASGQNEDAGDTRTLSGSNGASDRMNESSMADDTAEGAQPREHDETQERGADGPGADGPGADGPGADGDASLDPAVETEAREDATEGHHAATEGQQNKPAEKGTGKTRRLSPYFVFAKVHREEAKARLASEGVSATATSVNKLIAEKWRALSEDEKAAFMQQHSSTPEGQGEGEEAAPAARAHNADGDGDDGPQTAAPGLPLSKVKKIIRMDKSVRQVSNEATNLIRDATELFLGALAEAALGVAVRNKRKTIKLDDLVNVAKTRKRFKDCLGTMLEKQGSSSVDKDDEEADATEDKENVPREPKAAAKAKGRPKAVPQPVNGAASITRFFKPSAAS